MLLNSELALSIHGIVSHPSVAYEYNFDGIDVGGLGLYRALHVDRDTRGPRPKYHDLPIKVKIANSSRLSKFELAPYVVLSRLEVVNLPSIETVDALQFDNYFTDLILSNLPALRNFELPSGVLSGNERKRLSQVVFENVDSLEAITLDDYIVKSTPVFRNLRSLKKLSIARAGLNKILLEGLPSIEYLDLSTNDLEHFEFTTSKSLFYLDLSFNKITHVPQDYAAMFHKDSQILNLCWNQLKNPDAIWNLVSGYPEDYNLRIKVTADNGCVFLNR